jgi:alkylated DNA repair dioxygenase AlkB
MPCCSCRSRARAIDLPDADLLFLERVDLGGDRDELLQELIEATPWQAEDIVVFGRTYPQPRLVAWYGDAGANYTYSGVRHDPLPWTATLQRLRERIQTLAGSPFNSVLLNYYRDGRDSMGLHADDEPELGPEPVIASLSLGAERKIVFQHRQRRDVDNLNLPLPHGSLLVMRGATQRHWKHGIRKLRRPCGPRLNLTFRRILTPAA